MIRSAYTPSFRIKQHPLEDAGICIYLYSYIYNYTEAISRGFWHGADAPFDRIRVPATSRRVIPEFSVTPVDGLPASGPAFRNEKRQCFES